MSDAMREDASERAQIAYWVRRIVGDAPRPVSQYVGLDELFAQTTLSDLLGDDVVSQAREMPRQVGFTMVMDHQAREAMNRVVDRQRAAKVDYELRGGTTNRSARWAASAKRRKAR
jgi:hypothetical protein